MKLSRFILSLTVGACFLYACDGRKIGTPPTVDSVTVTTPDISVSDFTTNDLTFFEVHGHVKSIKSEYETLLFTEDGNLATVNGKDPFVEREIEGDDYLLYTKKAGFIVGEDRMETRMEYTWKDGRPDSCAWVSESWIGHQSYKYDDKGLLVEMVTNQQDFGELPEVITAKYSYDQFDDHRNWLKRTILANDTVTETRTIEYYK